MDDSSHYQSQREAILSELASITTIERGTLAEEYREVPNPEGSGTIKKGPYFKHQCWENKKNRSKRITAQEAPLLREDLENGRLFTQLIEQLTELNIANARERRQTLTQSESPADGYAKKKLHQQALEEKYRETEAFLDQIPTRIQEEGFQSLTHWLEQSLRTAIQADACRIIENLLNDRNLIPEMAPSHELETIYRNRTRIVQTLFGPIRITRNYHYHTKARNGRYPLDDELELTGTYTPSVLRLICRASAQSGSYHRASIF